jgi:hypothetical protein
MGMNRKQVREALDTIPMDRILSVPGELTHKQKTFARLVAQGSTGAGAYREAYKSKGKPKTAGNHAYALKKHEGIKATIEAFRLSNAAAEYHTPQQLRDLVIHSLVQVVIDPDAKHATKVAAAKVLGTVTEVAAFTERREVHTIKSSGDAKNELLAKLRALMTSTATDATARDANALIDELTPPDDDLPAGTAATPTTPDSVWSPTQPMHTIPHTRTSSESDPPPPNLQVSDAQWKLTENTPLNKTE